MLAAVPQPGVEALHRKGCRLAGLQSAGHSAGGVGCGRQVPRGRNPSCLGGGRQPPADQEVVSEKSPVLFVGKKMIPLCHLARGALYV